MAVWALIGLAVAFDVSFAFPLLNAAFLLAGFLTFAALGFMAVSGLRARQVLPRWLVLPVAGVASIAIVAVGLVVSLAAALDSSVLFDSRPEYLLQPDGRMCQAQIFGGATVTFSRLDLLLYRPLFFGLERKVAHHSRILNSGERISLDEECSKIAHEG